MQLIEKLHHDPLNSESPGNREPWNYDASSKSSITLGKWQKEILLGEGADIGPDAPHGRNQQRTKTDQKSIYVKHKSKLKKKKIPKQEAANGNKAASVSRHGEWSLAVGQWTVTVADSPKSNPGAQVQGALWSIRGSQEGIGDGLYL